jgi:hypothetical protein
VERRGEERRGDAMQWQEDVNGGTKACLQSAK